MNLYDEFFTLVEHLENRSIPYAVIGGIAMAFHDLPRFTKDIDLLIAPPDLDEIRALFESLGYFESSDPWTFRNTKATLYRFAKTQEQDYLVVDVVVGHEQRHRDIIEQAVVEGSEAGPVPIARKEDLIWLKQLRNSDQDQVDIRRLSDDEDRTGSERTE
ncbi:MAG TPA: nucleotidyl transferase AbiEii/AbiGii toxin family protein [Rhodothermia bacterium]|nr:nucleotidyl transferase AbiEii/AbiGii toxin family protein [Rhodothermia bacterium]